MPVISVVVPVYNVEKYLHRCVDSILAQTFTDFELILVDDGSPDNCGIICDEYAEKDNRIHVIHKENGGLSDARNAGIDWTFVNSSSEWITFIDSDDWVHSQYLELLYFAVINGVTKVSSTKYIDRNEYSNDKTLLNKKYTKLLVEDFYCENHRFAISACGKLYYKRLFSGIRFPKGKLCEDAYTTHKLIFSVDEISFVDEFLYNYYYNPNSIMRSNWKPKLMDAFGGYEEEIVFFEKNGYTKARDRAICALAYTYYEQITKCESENVYKKELYQMRRALKKILHKNKIRSEFSIKVTPWFYECAYPKAMKIYWIIHGIKGKIKRVK